MIPTEVHAEHNSWRCWLIYGECEAPLVALVWQISGMVPRVILQVGKVGQCKYVESGTSKPETGTIEGPSGHLYKAGLSPHLVEVVQAALSKWEGGAADDVSLVRAGSDIDTSEVIVRRALDVLQHVRGVAPDSGELLSLLHDRSGVWATW